VPRGVLNVLTGDAKAIGEALIKSEAVRQACGGWLAGAGAWEVAGLGDVWLCLPGTPPSQQAALARKVALHGPCPLPPAGAGAQAGVHRQHGGGQAAGAGGCCHGEAGVSGAGGQCPLHCV
jgi:hypothetical protein